MTPPAQVTHINQNKAVKYRGVEKGIGLVKTDMEEKMKGIPTVTSNSPVLYREILPSFEKGEQRSYSADSPLDDFQDQVPFSIDPTLLKSFVGFQSFSKGSCLSNSSASLLKSRQSKVHIGIGKYHFSFLFHHTLYSAMPMAISYPMPDAGRPTPLSNPLGFSLIKSALASSFKE